MRRGLMGESDFDDAFNADELGAWVKYGAVESGR